MLHTLSANIKTYSRVRCSLDTCNRKNKQKSKIW